MHPLWVLTDAYQVIPLCQENQIKVNHFISFPSKSFHPSSSSCESVSTSI
jgi:hypothetical protein